MTQCENCIHKKICDLWEEIDGADAGCYSLGDTCYYFDAIPAEIDTIVCIDEATSFTEDTRNRDKELARNLKALESDDLIRRSQAYEALTKQQQLTPSVLRRVLLQVPPVDAVEVVRCSDCNHWKKDVAGCTENVGRCDFANYFVGAFGYCVCGERKEGADNG